MSTQKYYQQSKVICTPKNNIQMAYIYERIIHKERTEYIKPTARIKQNIIWNTRNISDVVQQAELDIIWVTLTVSWNMLGHLYYRKYS